MSTFSPGAALLVSVIIPCFKMGQYLATALDSVGKQTYPHWEVILVDDAGPEDGISEIVAAFSKAHPDRRVVFKRHDKNKGVSASRNTAFAAARGDMLALLDPDDLWLPTHLESRVEVFLKHPEISVAVSPAWIFAGDPDVRQPVPEFFCDWERQTFPYSMALRNGIPTSSVVLHRARTPIELVFDTNLSGGEDWDLWFRLVQAGAKFDLAETPTSLYRKHSTAATNQEEKLRIQLRSLARKHGLALFEYQWVASLQVTHIVRMHEEQIRVLTTRVNRPCILTRVACKVRQALSFK